MQSLAAQLPGQSETFTKQLLRIAFKFAGEPQTEDVIESIYQEAEADLTNIPEDRLEPNKSSM
jgi:hypothetical protein